MKLYVFCCPAGCKYAPGYHGKRPVGDQFCPNCRSQMKQYTFETPMRGPAK